MAWVSSIERTGAETSESEVHLDSALPYWDMDGRFICTAVLEMLAQLAALHFLLTDPQVLQGSANLKEAFMIGVNQMEVDEEVFHRHCFPGQPLKIGMEVVRVLSPMVMIRGWVSSGGQRFLDAQIKLYGRSEV